MHKPFSGPLHIGKIKRVVHMVTESYRVIVESLVNQLQWHYF